MNFRFLSVFLLLALATFLRAEKSADTGKVSGSVIDTAANRPVEYVTIALKNEATGATVRAGATDRKGGFAVENVPFGSYRVVYGALGAEASETSPVLVVDAEHRAVALGALPLGAAAVKMEKFEVKAKQSAQLNSIDRKTYNVGKEIQSTTGSASDLLQNIPSVQVDIDGNVSLRGSDNVLILVDGRSSAMMGKSRAEVLQQLPADAIDKIEVITNPSAKYKPDGTAGIINIALKKKHEALFSTVANVSVGNNDRYNAGLSATYNPGGYSVFGSASVRQDDRERRATDVRTIIDPVTGVVTRAEKKSLEHSRPLSELVRAGGDYKIDDHNKVGASANYTAPSTAARRTTMSRAMRAARSSATLIALATTRNTSGTSRPPRPTGTSSRRRTTS
jgi:Carboxypeptidase regulatory-like domain/TonB-dependent Receptor Plug Domain